MTNLRKKPPGVQDKAADREGEFVTTTSSKVTSTPSTTRLTSTTSSCTTTTSTTTTAMADVLYPEDAPYNTDIEGIDRRLNEDIRRMKSAETIELLLLLGHTIRRYVRYRDLRERESRRFFEEIEPHVIGLCAGHPEIPFPPSKSEPLRWVKWLADAKVAIERPSRMPGQAGETGPKITLEEANIQVRRLLKETPSWDWTVKKLVAKVKESLGAGSQGLIAKCPAWEAYNERRSTLRKEGMIKTVSLTSEMEAVLGVDADSLVELTAEQEAEDLDDTRKAKLYLSHKKKREGRES